METSVNQAISMRDEDRSYRTPQKKSTFPFIGLLLFLLLLSLGGMGFVIYTHHLQLAKMQEWLSGDADNLEQIGNELLERSVGLENNITALQNALKQTEDTLKKTQARASNNRKVNASQAKALKKVATDMTDATSRISAQEAKSVETDANMTDIANRNAEQDETLQALKAVDTDFLAFEKSTNDFRKNTNNTIAEMTQQLSNIRTRIDQIEQRAARHERLLVTMQREQKQLQQRLQAAE